MSFTCVVVTPEQQVLEEKVSQAIVPAEDGLIGILTDRAPLLARLGLGLLRVDLAGGARKTVVIDGGVAQMKDNKLTILANAAWAADQLDLAAAKAEYDAASNRPADDAKAAGERTRLMRRAELKQEAAQAR